MGPAKTGGLFHPCLLLPTTQSDILTFGATRTVVPASSLSRADYWSKKALQLESIFASTNEQKTSLILSFLMAAFCFFSSLFLHCRHSRLFQKGGKDRQTKRCWLDFACNFWNQFLDITVCRWLYYWLSNMGKFSKLFLGVERRIQVDWQRHLHWLLVLKMSSVEKIVLNAVSRLVIWFSLSWTL